MKNINIHTIMVTMTTMLILNEETPTYSITDYGV